MTSSSSVFPDPEGPVITSVSPAPTLRSAPPRMVRDPPPTCSSPGPTLGPDATVSNGHGSGHRHRRRRVLGDDHQGGDQFPLTLEHEFYDQIPAGAVQLAGRFVKQQQDGRCRRGRGDRYPLLLPTGQTRNGPAADRLHAQKPRQLDRPPGRRVAAPSAGPPLGEVNVLFSVPNPRRLRIGSCSIRLTSMARSSSSWRWLDLAQVLGSEQDVP